MRVLEFSSHESPSDLDFDRKPSLPEAAAVRTPIDEELPLLAGIELLGLTKQESRPRNSASLGLALSLQPDG